MSNITYYGGFMRSITNIFDNSTIKQHAGPTTIYSNY